MIHVLPRWSFGYLLQAKPKHTAAGHEVICGTVANAKNQNENNHLDNWIYSYAWDNGM